MGQGVSGLGEHASNNAPNLNWAGQKKPRRPAAAPGLTEGSLPVLTGAASQVSFGHVLLPVVLLWGEVIVEKEA